MRPPADLVTFTEGILNGKLDLRLFNISVCALLSLRPYGSRDFEIGSCCKHGFLIFVTVSVAVD